MAEISTQLYSGNSSEFPEIPQLSQFKKACAGTWACQFQQFQHPLSNHPNFSPSLNYANFPSHLLTGSEHVHRTS